MAAVVGLLLRILLSQLVQVFLIVGKNLLFQLLDPKFLLKLSVVALVLLILLLLFFFSLLGLVRVRLRAFALVLVALSALPSCRVQWAL